MNKVEQTLNLPQHLEEELNIMIAPEERFVECEGVGDNNGFYEMGRKDVTYGDLKSFILKCYQAGKAAGYKEGLLGAIEMMPDIKDDRWAGWDKKEPTRRAGWYAYEHELLSRLEDKLKGL